MHHQDKGVIIKKHWWEWDETIDDGVRIVDPDGFGRQDPTIYNAKYTVEEFLFRRASCTCIFNNDRSFINGSV